MSARDDALGRVLDGLSTPLTKLSEDDLVIGGRPVAEIIREDTVEDVVALVMGLDLGAEQKRVLRACLVASPDHGLVSNATTAALAATATSRGGVAHGVAAGLLAIGPVSISPQPVMAFLAEAVRAGEASGRPPEEIARELVERAAASRERIPGFGSPVHPSGDPRVEPLKQVVVEAGCWGPNCVMFESLGDALAAGGRPLPANEVGLTGACLADLGLSPEQGEAVAVIGTVPSLVANVLAELQARPRFVVARDVFDGSGGGGR